MKRILRYLPIALMGILLFAGCKKDGLVTFSATTEPYNGTEKMYIADNYACWSNGDAVKINSTTATATIRSGSSDSYVELSGVPQATDYYAIYPATACAGTFGNSATITLPNVQQYNIENNAQVLSAPMAAVAYDRDGNGGRVLRFQNLCLILKVHIEQKNNIIKAIRLVDPDSSVALSGSGTVTFSGSPATPTLSMSTPAYNVTLSMESGVNLNVSGGTDFYIAVPAMASGVDFDIYTKDMLNQTRKLTVTTHQALHSNTIVKVDGPTQLNNDSYEFYDWIRSDSSGYIDLGVKPSLGAKMELTFSLPENRGRVCSQYLCGSRQGGGKQWFTITGSGGSGGAGAGFNVIFCGETASNTPAAGGWARTVGDKYLISVEAEAYENGVRSTAVFQDLTNNLVNTLYTPKYTTTVNWGNLPNVFLFAFNSVASQKHACMKCYGFRYLVGSSVIHDFVPCKEKTGLERVGVYDMKTGQFIVPVQTGTTPFSVGKDPVPEP